VKQTDCTGEERAKRAGRLDLSVALERYPVGPAKENASTCMGLFL
jgi:hypothetical protein